MDAALQKIINLAEREYLQYAGLPFAVYLASREGIFLRYNEEARKLLGLPAEPGLNASVSGFYNHPSDREDNLNRLLRLEKGQWLRNTTIDLKVNGQVRHVRDFTKAIWSEDGQEIIALLCLMVPINKGGRYHRLFNDLPVGIFSFRKGSGLTNANPHFLEMYGYDSLEDVLFREAGDFIKYPEDLEEMERRLWEKGRVFNEYQEHVRRDGSVFTAAISARAVWDSDGNWIGTEGILEDVTMEAIYFNLVNEVPIGLYKVRINEKGEHILLHCNQHFANNRGIEHPDGIIGRDLREWHISPQAFQEFHDALIRKDREGQSLVDYILPAYNGKGELRRYEVHVRLLKDASGNIIGRVGAERDVTDYLETKQQLDELTTDIGKVLHSYSSTLIHVKHTMDAVIRSFVTKDLLPKEGGPPDEGKIREQISRQVGILQTSVHNILEKGRENRQLGEGAARQLEHIMGLLARFSQEQNAAQKLAVIRDGAIRVKSIINDAAEKGNFPRELIKEARRQLREILRLCSLATLYRGVDTVLEMETVVNNLRSYILTRVKYQEEPQRIDLYDVIVGVARKMEEFAANRAVELRMNIKAIRNVYIDGYEDGLARALLNILHNAIKYSWTRKGPDKAFVMVEGKADADWVFISIENWGVAITKEELKKGLVFRVGYRGVNSSDRRRPGTGLGLYDSLKVAEKHKGKLTVTSEPSLGNPEDDYSNPFITKVTLQLPRNEQLI
ncbi:MAG: PAS domain-containing protein [Phaeodactylibacter sp.]|nr:PAS domain-containing protein [Phaeodactylibacter sp.]MCB9265863.1 PAS domain-containing protein [Lewinellaceae bacterium]MCB9288799.1 PAS domain-containing protein [Lewinellaceae bacterium]